MRSKHTNMEIKEESFKINNIYYIICFNISISRIFILFQGIHICLLIDCLMITYIYNEHVNKHERNNIKRHGSINHNNCSFVCVCAEAVYRRWLLLVVTSTEQGRDSLIYTFSCSRSFVPFASHSQRKPYRTLLN